MIPDPVAAGGMLQESTNVFGNFKAVVDGFIPTSTHEESVTTDCHTPVELVERAGEH